MPAPCICATAWLIVFCACALTRPWHTWLFGLVLKSCRLIETITRTLLACAALTKLLIVAEWYTDQPVFVVTRLPSPAFTVSPKYATVESRLRCQLG